MIDVERITTTERHAELREQIAQAADATRLGQQFNVGEVVDAVLPFIEQAKAEAYEQARSDWPRMLTNAEVAAFNRGQAAERVRVVEGLIATIKALYLTTEVRAEADGHAVTNFTNVDSVGLAAVLAVVEAAREDTT